MRIFKTKGFARFTRREAISDASLEEAIDRVERGQIDANLGGGLIKQRISRTGQGRSGGYRMIVAHILRNKAVFLYAFAKNERDNIGPGELTDLRKIGMNWLAASPEELARAIAEGVLEEIEIEEESD